VAVTLHIHHAGTQAIAINDDRVGLFVLDRSNNLVGHLD